MNVNFLLVIQEVEPWVTAERILNELRCMTRLIIYFNICSKKKRKVRAYLAFPNISKAVCTNF